MPVKFKRQIRFSSRPEELLEEYAFNGGLVADVSETKLQPNQSPNLYNLTPNNTGSIKTRNGYLRYNSIPIGSASDQSNTGASTGSSAMTSTATYVAQTFIPSGTIACTMVDVYLAMNTLGEEQNVRVELWATSGGLPTTLLTNGQSKIKLVSGTSETAYSFRFREPVALTAATTYAIVIKPFINTTTQSVNRVNAYYRGATYANGSVITSSDTGLNWTADTAKDLRFVVYSGGDTPVTGLIRYYNSSGVQQLITKVGSSLYRGNDSTGVMTAITFPTGVALTAANFLDWTIVNDTLLVVDGSNRIKKYRGSTNSNYTTGTITVTNASTTVTGSGTSWSTATNAAIGEYIQLPDTKWYKITAIASDTSLTIETAYQASTLAGQTYIISPWGAVMGKLNSSTAPSGLTVPRPNYIANHANRVWTLTGNQINWSVLDTSVTEAHFNDWDTSNNSGVLNIPSGKGDTGTGLYSLGNTLYVFQRHAIWGIYGNSPANFELRNITNEIGMISKKTLVEWNDVLIFQSDQGVYLFDGTNLKNISDGIVNSLISAWASDTSPVATLWDNKYLIAYTPSGGSHNTEALFYDLTRNTWWRINGTNINVFSNWVGGTDDGEVYFGSSSTGTVSHWDTGTNDDGYEISTVYDTPSIGFGSGISDKAIKKFYIQQLSKGDWDMTVTQLSDITSDEIVGTSINLSPGTSSLWGVAQWGVDVWSSEGSMQTDRIAEFQGIAKYFKYRLEEAGYDTGIEALGIIVTARKRKLQ